MRTHGRPCLWPILILLAVIAGCSDSTDPGEILADGGSSGTVDPDAGSAVFKTINVILATGEWARIELLGGNMVLDPDGRHIDLTVSVRNAGRFPLRAPLLIWLENFEPYSVTVANADTTQPPAGSMLPVMPWAYGFVYDDEFGEEGILEPGETSDARLWRFHTEAQESFGFGMRAEPDPWPLWPVISGRCFWDLDRDGHPSRDEPPLFPGVVHVAAPDGSRTMIRVDERGGYIYELRAPGLYRVAYEPGFETFVALEFTTPNPRHVVITADDTGALRGFHEAHFGANTLLPLRDPVIRFTDTPIDSLHMVDYRLLEVGIDDLNHIACTVGYSGCEPGHRFSLWMTGGFMESLPVQVNVVLVHETDEVCDAAFQEEIGFDLGPLRYEFMSMYGDDELLLNVIDFHGEVHRILWHLDPKDEDEPRG